MRALIIPMVIMLSLAACHLSKPTPNQADPPISTESESEPDYVAGQVLVLLKPAAAAKELAMAHEDIGMQMKGRSSRSQNQWIFTYDADKIEGKQLVETLLASPLVENAQLISLK